MPRCRKNLKNPIFSAHLTIFIDTTESRKPIKMMLWLSLKEGGKTRQYHQNSLRVWLLSAVYSPPWRPAPSGTPVCQAANLPARLPPISMYNRLSSRPADSPFLHLTTLYYFILCWVFFTVYQPESNN